ncbi:MAG: tRNA lysidine(34) synthetase TilS [Candidatus Pacebacteria bacterium]|nr:tRNA lysidine(34) synthetase TilS [Candidatus Paceibacterota bacterium]
MPLESEARPPAAVTVDEFAQLMAQTAEFESAPSLLVAVSGGSDSMALLHLARTWARQRGGMVMAVTVDHGIRPESRAEAEWVGGWSQQMGVTHQITTLDPRSVRSQTVNQDWLRQLRYRALADVARQFGFLHLLTAHHQGDQAETLLMRLGRGSGLMGLAAMQPRVFSADYQHLRPLLTVPKDRLTATCLAANLQWATDPSNDNPNYARIRVRQAAAQLAELGLTSERLAETAARLGGDRAMELRLRDQFLARHGYFHPAGFVRLHGKPWNDAEFLILRLALARIMAVVGKEDYAPRGVRLERLRQTLASNAKIDCCLAGCRLVSHDDGLLIFREAAAMAAEMVLTGSDGTVVWDNRFMLRWTGDIGDGWSFGAMGPHEVKDWRQGLLTTGIPRRIMVTLPVIRSDGAIIHVPHLTEIMAHSPFSLEPVG